MPADTIKTIIGVKRKTKYSPNHIGNDGMIFSMVADKLQTAGYCVKELTESEFIVNDTEGCYIFNMARESNSIRRLKKLEDKGSLVINSGYGIENCIRDKMTEKLLTNKIPYPKSIIIDVNEDIEEALLSLNAKSFWVKRGDSHTIHREDISYARNVEEAKSIVKEFALRDIPNAVINEHLAGDLIKFYGVADSDFFFWFYPYENNISKFGLEAVNGPTSEFPFSSDNLKQTCNHAAKVLKVDIYGGDCIVSPDGSFKIIDFNDWPSFAPCRNEAAPYITEKILQKIKAYHKG